MTIAILVVAGFGIYNILSILVNQKKRDIAILRSMGFTPNDIVKLFFNQGLLLGLVGGIIGLFLGNIICHIMAQIEVVPGRMSGPGNKMIISLQDVLLYVF
jgi:lipoprotein-releasing system permease protein